MNRTEQKDLDTLVRLIAVVRADVEGLRREVRVADLELRQAGAVPGRDDSVRVLGLRARLARRETELAGLLSRAAPRKPTAPTLPPVERMDRDGILERRGAVLAECDRRLYHLDRADPKVDQDLVLWGRAAPYYDPQRPGGSCERKGEVWRIAPGAFARTLQNLDRVELTYRHDSTLVIATTVNGTLELSEDDKGLRFEACVKPDDAAASAIMRLAHRADMGCSFEGQVEETSTRLERGQVVRTLHRIGLAEITLTPCPAFRSTFVVCTPRAACPGPGASP